MNLREWISNSQKVYDNLRSEGRLKDKVLKVLGIFWNTVTDDIQIYQQNKSIACNLPQQREKF